MASHPVHAFAARLLGKSAAALDAEERRVLTKIEERLPISRDAGDVDEETATLGDRLADRVAAVGGSWGFILAFTLLLVGWMLLNSGVLPRLGHAFDPYPYIFLNLMLSTLAAIQAPVIMMSQNRAQKKDRLKADLDYASGVKSELMLQSLHGKVDELRELVGARRDFGAPDARD
jgi:uncharacterized membrane protein